MWSAFKKFHWSYETTGKGERDVSVCLAKYQLNKNHDVTIIYADMYTLILNNYRHPFFQDNGYSIEIGGETVILHGL